MTAAFQSRAYAPTPDFAQQVQINGRKLFATLRGTVVSTGGEEPAVWFEHWADGSSSTSMIAVGQQPAATLDQRRRRSRQNE